MKTAQDIIIAPVITEKSMSGIADKKYTFKVAKDANKIEIADAVAKLFKVDVAKVNTINVRGQARRMGRYNGYTAADIFVRIGIDPCGDFHVCGTAFFTYKNF